MKSAKKVAADFGSNRASVLLCGGYPTTPGADSIVFEKFPARSFQKRHFRGRRRDAPPRLFKKPEHTFSYTRHTRQPGMTFSDPMPNRFEMLWKPMIFSWSEAGRDPPCPFETLKLETLESCK